jgi:hypothetical protein
MIEELRNEAPRARFILFADASLSHRMERAGEREELSKAKRRGDLHIAPAGTQADQFILRSAERCGGVVVSNDSFREFHEVYPWLLHRRRLLGAVHSEVPGWMFDWRILDRAARSRADSSERSLKGSRRKRLPREPIPPSGTVGGTSTYLTDITDIEHLWTADSRRGLYKKSDLEVVAECAGRDRRYWISSGLHCSTMDGKYLWRTIWVDGLYGELDDTLLVRLRYSGGDFRVAGLANGGG